MQQKVPGIQLDEKVETCEEVNYTQKFNEMVELLDLVLTMKIDYYQGKFPGSTKDEILSLINYEIIESKYKAWNIPVPVEIENFFRKNLLRLNKIKR